MRRSAEQEVLDPEPLLGGVAAVVPAVLEGSAVVPAPRPAPLLEEAPYGGAARALRIRVAMGHPEPPVSKDPWASAADAALAASVAASASAAAGMSRNARCRRPSANPPPRR